MFQEQGMPLCACESVLRYSSPVKGVTDDGGLSHSMEGYIIKRSAEFEVPGGGEAFSWVPGSPVVLYR